MSVSEAGPFDRRSLRERTIAYLRGQIISGTLQPGEHVREVSLSDKLGVSRGTLREALRSLEGEGLLVNDGKGRMWVRKLSAQEIAEVFEVRTALEILAATKLAGSDRRAEFADLLERKVEDLREPDLGFGERIEADLGFHALMCELTGSGTLSRSWLQLNSQIRMMIIAAGPERAVGRMRYEAHLPIVAAIRAGDVDAVRKTLTEHMHDFTRRYVGDALAAEPGETPADRR
ncbi:GntR family transcriptional regulator [Streptomyces rugosispiralis]|uniref:GntR family transcriptional regulator n=1 Tax=Streptomyces rugosispiralis TaxID=2967341 RepID=A0ABT1UYP9_9ACTN|nr:GntR family transcriptional regulator [Streptomyces rugosispiralis]MCQ8190250.1 GntR family transcriptional regulator [Streptomyces rugosispiralis]